MTVANLIRKLSDLPKMMHESEVVLFTMDKLDFQPITTITMLNDGRIELEAK